MSLPKGYEMQKSESNYLNKFEDGATKIRVLSDFIIGWTYWVPNPEKQGTNKPVRVKEMPNEVPEEAVADKYGNFIKHFWCAVVYNYNEKKIQIMEITQKSIQDPIYDLEMDEDFGDVKQYDIKIVREKEGERVTYSVKALPPKELTVEVANAYAEKKINLGALYSSEDPFNTEPEEITEEEKEAITNIVL